MFEEVNVWMTRDLIPPTLDTAPGNELVQGHLKFVAKLRQRLKPLAPETSASFKGSSGFHSVTDYICTS